MLFDLLNIAGSRKYVAQTVDAVIIKPDLKYYLGAEASEEDVSDLAD